MKDRSILILVSVFLSVFLLLSQVYAEQEEGKLPLAPDFQFKNPQGQWVVLSDIIHKGPVLISFWALWCKPCLKELPHIQKLYDKYRDQGLQVIAISEDAPRSISKVKSYIAGKKYDFLVLLDDDNAIQRKFSARALPFTVLMDKKRRIVHQHLGYRPGDELVLEEKLLPLFTAQEEYEPIPEEEHEPIVEEKTEEDHIVNPEVDKTEQQSENNEKSEKWPPEALDFQFKDPQGRWVVMSDLLKEGPVLLNFWAMRKNQCLEELPHIQKLYDKYRDQGLHVIAISEDTPLRVSQVKDYIAEKEYDFLVLLDDNNAIQKKFDVADIPFTMIVDEKRRIVHQQIGYQSGDELVLEEKLLPLLGAQKKDEPIIEEKVNEDRDKKPEANKAKREQIRSTRAEEYDE